MDFIYRFFGKRRLRLEFICPHRVRNVIYVHGEPKRRQECKECKSRVVITSFRGPLYR